MSEKADHNVCRLCKWLSFLINNADQQMTRLFQLNDARMRSWSKRQQPWLSGNVAEYMYVGAWMQLGFKGGVGGAATVDGGSDGGGGGRVRREGEEKSRAAADGDGAGSTSNGGGSRRSSSSSSSSSRSRRRRRSSSSDEAGGGTEGGGGGGDGEEDEEDDDGDEEDNEDDEEDKGERERREALANDKADDPTTMAGWRERHFVLKRILDRHIGGHFHLKKMLYVV